MRAWVCVCVPAHGCAHVCVCVHGVCVCVHACERGQPAMATSVLQLLK